MLAGRLTPGRRECLYGSERSDGYLTSRGTFQKLYVQRVLRSWIDQSPKVSSIALEPSIFYIFRREEDRAG